ncbi:MAG: glycosyltransferase family 9 protein [Muribaculaceae bacterium]|nr:glycosyltransferase family 9 protein [Muribaculaceae bacterium]
MAAKADIHQGLTVLMARFSALGDVAMTIPVVYSVCRCNPSVRFVMVTRPSMTAMFVNAPSNLVLFGADVKGEYAGVGGMRRLARRLMEEYSPTMFADLHNVLRTHVLGFFLRMSGVTVSRLFKPRSNRRELTRRRNKVMLPLTGQRDYYREVFKRLGLSAQPRFHGLYDGAGTSDPSLFASVTAPKAQGERWVGIAPFAAHQGKIYPAHLMEKVLGALQEQADGGRPLRIFLFGGGEDEEARLNSWAAMFPASVSLAGRRLGFAVELALLNHMDVVLSMDSGNMHLAAIAGAPTLSIWGATHPYCGFRAWRQGDESTLQVPLECRPCSVFGNKPCHRGDYLCLTGIRPETVVAAIERYIR